MSNYFRIVNITDRVSYGIGTFSVAKSLLFAAAYRLKDKTLCFFGDESYPCGKDEYPILFRNINYDITPNSYFDMGEFDYTIGEEKYDISDSELHKIITEFEGKPIDGLFEKIIDLLNKRRSDYGL